MQPTPSVGVGGRCADKNGMPLLTRRNIISTALLSLCLALTKKELAADSVLHSTLRERPNHSKLEPTSTCGTHFLQKLRPPNRRPLISTATKWLGQLSFSASCELLSALHQVRIIAQSSRQR